MMNPLSWLLREEAVTRPPQLTPCLPATAPCEPTPGAAHLAAQNSRLRLELDAATTKARRAAERAERAEQALQELRIATAGHPAEELIRARRALLRLEDIAEGCRRDHGGNTIADPLARCAFCGDRTAGALASCDRADCRVKELDVEMAFVRREDQ